ncbi:MAG: DUF4097 family beta strand repeat-containing protein [Anaerolineales bacterium]
MNRPFSIAAMLLCVFLAACNPDLPRTTALLPEDFSLSEGQSITIDVNSGTLNITQGENGHVKISGTISNSQVVDYKTTLEADGLHLVAKYRGNSFFQPEVPPIRINLSVPTRILIKVSTFDANVDIQDYSGEVNITSVAGDVLVKNVSGLLTLMSNRGNVIVEKSSGELHILGNYGLLSLLDPRGTISASTIMGTIKFNGKIGTGDDLNFETDHGPVEIQLAQDSDAIVQVDTTSGVVTCSIPGIFYKGQRCAGTLHGGQGKLKVRTVSGNVSLQPLP